MLEAVAEQLRRHGVPSQEAARLLEELEDHLADLLTEQGGSMNESVEIDDRVTLRLGRPDVLVAAALANRRPGGAVGRHPVLSFVVAPIPLAILSWYGYIFAGFGLLELVGWVFGDAYTIAGRAVRDWPAGLVYAVNGMAAASRFVPPAATVALLCWCGRRAGVGRRWTLTASGLVGLLAGLLVVQVRLPAEPGQGSLLLGLGFPVYQWVNLAQVLVPLAVGILFLLGKRNRALVKA
jgi:hypothetical protein